MKILIVCPRLCYGGAERVAVSLANGFVERGHQVTVLANLYDEVTYHLESKVTCWNLVSTNRHKILKWGSAILRIRRCVKQEHPDIVIGIIALCSLVSRIATIGFKVPVIATEHDAFERPETAPMPFGIRFAKFCLNHIYKCVTVLTESDKKIIGNRLRNVVVMPNPLAIPLATKIPDKGKNILAAGRVDNWYDKGFDVLIQAWGQIANKYPEWTLQIAGVYMDAKTRSYLDGIAREQHVESRVKYLGFVEDMTSLYQKSAVFVLSSRYEGFGLVLIEAMSQGCACVACDYHGRQREIITSEREGLVCAPDNVTDLAAAMERVISDDVYRQKVMTGGMDRAAYYSIPHIIERWELLINQLINN